MNVFIDWKEIVNFRYAVFFAQNVFKGLKVALGMFETIFEDF